jgi:hypothetical protein
LVPQCEQKRPVPAWPQLAQVLVMISRFLERVCGIQ